MYLWVSGSRGRERGEFSNLQGISTSTNGRIVVADSNNQCIQVRDLLYHIASCYRISHRLGVVFLILVFLIKEHTLGNS